MKFAKYDSYKESGVEWLGEIPSNWEVKRVKEISNIKGRIGYRGYTKEDLVARGEGAIVLGAGEINEYGFIQLEKTQYLSWDKYYESPEIMLSVNEILIAQRGSTIGKVGLITKNIGKATINPTMAIIKNIKINPKFLMYNLMSIKIHNFIQSQRYNTAIPMISQENIGNYLVFNIAAKAQEKILNFLDQKTSQIDRKIKLLQEKKESYEELKKSLINEIVCRGLDKDVELKDSGIEWIGKIPKHWIFTRGKNIFYELCKSKISASEGQSKGKYKFFTSSVTQTKWINVFTENSEGIIFSTGGIAGVHYCNEKFSYSTDCWAIKSKNQFLKYFYYYFKSILYEIDIIAFQGAGLRHLQKDFIKLSELPKPPIEEQVKIANYLDEKTSKIEKIISKINNQIETLKEFRKTLINDVVTGKVRIQDE